MFYVGQMFSWDWREDWKTWIELAKSLRCRFDQGQKAWIIPHRAAAIELVRALLDRTPAAMIRVFDFDTAVRVRPADYISAAYAQPKAVARKALPFQCLIEGRDEVYLSMPRELDGSVPPECELAAGLAEDGCEANWVEGRGYRLRVNVAEAVDYLRTSGVCPVVGWPLKLGDEPIITDFVDDILPHQCVGVAFLTKRAGGAILADDMGLGKTMQSILGAEQLKADGVVNRLLIVCPVTLVGNWRYELRRWGSTFVEGRDFMFLPYSRMHYYGDKPELRQQLLDWSKGRRLLVIADEAHYLKNAGSQRTREFIRMCLETRARPWLLTGTPVTKDNGNLWTLAHLMDHPVAKRYGPAFLAGLTGSHTVRLSGALRTHMLVRKKSDVLQLPEKTRAMVQTEVDWEGWLTAQVMRDLLSADDADKAMEHLMRLKRLSAYAKAERTIEEAEKVLAEGRKVVIFSDHRQPLQQITAALARYGVVAIDGSVPGPERTKIVDRFQRDANTRVFAGQIKAAGVGITLTAASDVIFNDLTWLPADMHQAEDRCHRIGASQPVSVRYLVDCNMPIDYLLSVKLAMRSAEIASFEQSKQTVLEEVRKWLKERGKAA